MNKLQFAQLINLIVARTGRELNKHDISDLEALTNVEPDNEVYNFAGMRNMLLAMRDGRKSDAIKIHLALTRMGLKESKEAIELVMDKLVRSTE